MFDQLDRQRFAAGAVIFRKHDQGDCAYLVESGAVEISDPDTGYVIAQVGSGELIGEIALIDRDARTATAKASSAAVLITIKREFMEQLLLHTDPIIRHLLNVVLGRFRTNMQPRSGADNNPVREASAGNSLQETATKKIALLQDLSYGLTASQFVLHYQPIFRLEDNQIAGFEALIRWNHPSCGMVYPLEFIALAEHTGLISEIGLWAVAQACTDWKLLRPLTKGDAPFVSVNVSGIQLADPHFAEQMIRIQNAHAMAASELKLELTESSLIKQPELARSQLRLLSDHGNSIALDDYGTAYSGLEYLQNYPFDTVKIDQRFVREMLNSSLSFQLVMSSIDMCKTLQLGVVAEGIETEEVARILKVIGCVYGQGYLFGRPKPLAEMLSRD